MSRVEALQFLDENLEIYEKEVPCGRFMVIESSSGAFVGTVSLLKRTEEVVHLGYALFPEFWGRGYATELVEAGRDYFIGTGLIGERIFAITDPGNEASEKVLRKTAFRVLEEDWGDEKERLWCWAG